jgi:hypothetical protein
LAEELANALAMIGPMPETVINRWQTSSLRARVSIEVRRAQTATVIAPFKCCRSLGASEVAN